MTAAWKKDTYPRDRSTYIEDIAVTDCSTSRLLEGQRVPLSTYHHDMAGSIRYWRRKQKAVARRLGRKVVVWCGFFSSFIGFNLVVLYTPVIYC